MFCPKCGALLVPKKVSGKKVMGCSCGYSSKEKSETKITDDVSSSEPMVEVVEKDFEAMPLVDMECPKCKHKKSYFWEVQTRASDEPATKFYKCEKCKHIWRDYS